MRRTPGTARPYSVSDALFAVTPGTPKHIHLHHGPQSRGNRGSALSVTREVSDVDAISDILRTPDDSDDMALAVIGLEEEQAVVINQWHQMKMLGGDVSAGCAGRREQPHCLPR